MARIKQQTGDAAKGKVKLSASAAEQPDWNKEHPAFCFRYLQSDYNLDSLTAEQKITFLERLRRLSELPWTAITGAPRHGLGYEKIANYKGSLPQGLSEDTTVIAFRCFGMMPILGFRRHHVLHLIWLDPKGELYDH